MYNNMYVYTYNQVEEEQKRFMMKVYNWMATGLFVTEIVAKTTKK